MKTPDTNPQFEEFEMQNRFRVEVLRPERTFKLIQEPFRTKQGAFSPVLKLGILKSEAGLFSEIGVDIFCLLRDYNSFFEGYTIKVNATYQDSKQSYWNPEETTKLRDALARVHKKRAVRTESETAQGIHGIQVFDRKENVCYIVNLGYSDERSAWKKQVELFNEPLKKEQNPILLLPPQLVRNLLEKRLQELIESPTPIPYRLGIDMEAIKPLVAPSLRIRQYIIPFGLPYYLLSQDLTERAVADFKRKMHNWGQFIERVVNAMSQIKEVPQGGLLTLRPPDEISQNLEG